MNTNWTVRGEIDLEIYGPIAELQLGILYMTGKRITIGMRITFLAPANLNVLRYISTNIIPMFMKLWIVLLESP